MNINNQDNLSGKKTLTKFTFYYYENFIYRDDIKIECFCYKVICDINNNINICNYEEYI